MSPALINQGLHCCRLWQLSHRYLPESSENPTWLVFQRKKRCASADSSSGGHRGVWARFLQRGSTRLPVPRTPRLSYVSTTHALWKEGPVLGNGKGRALAEVSARLRRREPNWNMATCAEILRSEFPEIDGQVFDYVTGERNRVKPLGRSKWKSGIKTTGGQCRRPLLGLSSA